MGFRDHTSHYLILLLIISSGLLGFWYFSSSRGLRFAVISLTVLGYVVWGVGHHYLEKRLSLSILLEYLLLGFVTLAAVSLATGF